MHVLLCEDSDTEESKEMSKALSEKRRGKQRIPIIILSPPSNNSSNEDLSGEDSSGEDSFNENLLDDNSLNKNEKKSVLDEMDNRLAQNLQKEEWNRAISPKDSDSDSSYSVISSDINDSDSDDTKAKKLSVREEERILREEKNAIDALIEKENNKRKNSFEDQAGSSKRSK